MMRAQTTSIVKGCVFFFCLAAIATSRAQENKQSNTPREPLLPRAPEMAAWTITYQYPDDKKRGNKKSPGSPKEHIASVQIEKTGDVYHKVTQWDTGKQSEAWSVRGKEVVKADADSRYVPTPADGPAADDFSKSDFEDLEWLAMKYYVSPKKGMVENFVFRSRHKERPHTRREKLALIALEQLRTKSFDGKPQPATRLPAEGETEDSPNRPADAEDTIILDDTTQLPVEYDQGSVKWTYEFTQPTNGQLEPPAEVNALLEHWDSFIKSSEAAGSPP